MGLTHAASSKKVMSVLANGHSKDVIFDGNVPSLYDRSIKSRGIFPTPTAILKDAGVVGLKKRDGREQESNPVEP